MSEASLVLIAFAVLPVVLTFAFAGCTGDDPTLIAAEKAADDARAHGDDLQHIIDQGKNDAEAAKYQNVVAADSTLVSYWRLDELETGKTDAHDSVPLNPLDGEYQFLQGISRGQTGALTAKDPNDKAAQFKGTTGFVQVKYDGLRNPPLSFSVEFWMLPEGVSSQTQVVFGSYQLDGVGSVVRGFVIDLIRAPSLKIRARLGNDTDFTAIEASLGDGLDFGGWRHVALTYSGPTQTVMLYVNAGDGKPDAQLPTPSRPSPVAYKVVNGNTTPLRIGAGQIDGGVAAGLGSPPIGSVGLFFEGRLDEVAIYRDVLDGATIKKHFQAAT